MTASNPLDVLVLLPLADEQRARLEAGAPHARYTYVTPTSPLDVGAPSAEQVAEANVIVGNVSPALLGHAANVARAIDSDDIKRPTTHMLLAGTLEVLGASLAGVTIERVEGATFFATLDVVNATGEHHHIDARPSDAVALAITCDEPIFASREVLECAGSPDFDAIEKDERSREEAKFHDFVEGLSPDDFKAPRQN